MLRGLFYWNNLQSLNIFFVGIISHEDNDGKCVKGKLDDDGKLVWVKDSCNGKSGVICAKRNIWEYIQHCYAQPPEEALGEKEEIPADEQDPVKYCR